MQFLDMTDVYKICLLLKPTIQDLQWFMSLQRLSVSTKDQWRQLDRLCTKYGNIDTLSFCYEPDGLGRRLARCVRGYFHWENSGIIRLMKFVTDHKECDQIVVDLKVKRSWNFGILCNLLNYPSNLFLRVEGPFPVFTMDVYICNPCRISHIEIVPMSPVVLDTLDKIRMFSDCLRISYPQ